MPEKRQLKRRQLIYYLRVYDVADNFELGHLVDVTTDGVLILTDEPVETGTIYELRLDLFTFMGAGKDILFEAECMHSEPDVNREYYDSGFRFTKISARDRETITSLIRRFGFDN